MVNSCVAYNCTSSYKAFSSIKFHKFPLDNKELLSKWLHAIRRKNFVPNKYTKICSLHFTSEDYSRAVVSNQPVLKKDSVPSVFDFPEHLLPKKKSRRVLDYCDHNVEIANEPLDEPATADAALSCTLSSGEELKKSVGVQTNIVGSQQEMAMEKLRRDKRVLQMKLIRRNKRVSSLKDMLHNLRENNVSNDALEEAMTNNFPEPLPFVLYQNEIENDPKSKNNYRYSPEVRKFCLTLYFYSPKAYNFVRSRSHLPDPATIRKWLSSRKCMPGILTEVLQHLRQKVRGTGGAYLEDVALMFDGMSIRKGRMYDKATDKHVGFVDVGGITPKDPEELATEALVFSIVSYTQKYKCPVAYFFTNKLDATVQAQLTKSVITELYDIGITVRSITCDGTKTNQKTYENLGCKLQYPNLQPYFKHPLNNDVTVQCIFDPPHMMKLCRNFLADCSAISLDKLGQNI